MASPPVEPKIAVIRRKHTANSNEKKFRYFSSIFGILLTIQ
jgi:hypothetical protein